MSGATALAVVLSLAAGLAVSVQAAALARLGERVGTIQAVGFSTVLAGAIGIVAMLVVRHSLDGISASLRAPAWMWLGGVLSAFIVLSVTVATPRVGVTAAIALVLGGQLVMAALIDRFG